MEAMNISSLVEDNGKTVKENNLSLNHNIKIGTKVKVTIDDLNAFGGYIKGEMIMFVVNHDRDCDGTPLYTISDTPVPYPKQSEANAINTYKCFGSTLVLSGFGESSLTVIDEEYVGRYKSFTDWMKNVRGNRA